MVGAAARAWVTSPQRAAMAIDRLMALRLVRLCTDLLCTGPSSDDTALCAEDACHLAALDMLACASAQHAA